MSEQVVIVDREDNRLELMDKDKAHRGSGVLHRAVSVVLYNSEGEVLIQKRSSQKDLWPSTWSNTVCTHPRDREQYIHAAMRRLREELGIDVQMKSLKVLYRFAYKAKYLSGDEMPGFTNGGLAEHELDTVVVGKYEGDVTLNKKEVRDYKWIHWDDLKEDIERNPDDYTPWFKLMVDNGKIDKVVG